MSEVIAYVAQAPFALRPMPLHPNARGRVVDGVVLGKKAPADIAHLAKRIFVERQLREGVALSDYKRFATESCQDEQVRLALYAREDALSLLFFAPNCIPTEYLGVEPHPFLCTIYSVEYGTISTNYQVSGLETIHLPEKILWLK